MFYLPNDEIKLTLGALSFPTGKLRAAILEGPPGSGKTALSEYAAHIWNAEYYYSLLHSWSDNQELFIGVNIPAAISGDADMVEEPGVLAKAAKASQENLVVVCLDEIDKVTIRTESLLLDFLQTGRVPIRPGVQLQGNVDNMVIFLTSNDERPLSDALLRRVRRVRMDTMSATLMVQIVMKSAQVSKAIAANALATCRKVSAHEENPFLSVQEVSNFCIDCVNVARNDKDIKILLSQWAARTPKGQVFAKNHVDTGSLWGEVKKAGGKY